MSKELELSYEIDRLHDQLRFVADKNKSLCGKVRGLEAELHALRAQAADVTSKRDALSNLAEELIEEKDSLSAKVSSLTEQLGGAGEPHGTKLPGNVEVIESLLAALTHMQVCGVCAERSWDKCAGGREALKAIELAQDFLSGGKTKDPGATLP